MKKVMKYVGDEYVYIHKIPRISGNFIRNIDPDFVEINDDKLVLVATVREAKELKFVLEKGEKVTCSTEYTTEANGWTRPATFVSPGQTQVKVKVLRDGSPSNFVKGELIVQYDD